jgi:hypothetical protein
MLRNFRRCVGFLIALALTTGPALAAGRPDVPAGISPALLAAMKWRQIGPFRGGRVVAVSGVPGDTTTWYFGGVAGGVL